jgi:sialate O-acetylesterase
MQWGWLLAIAAAAASLAGGTDLRLEVDLRTYWRFEIGDQPQYLKAGFNHGHWENILVPSPWENQGFPGYDGYAWYRTTVRIPKALMGKQLYLKLGRVDDVDRAYWNGTLIGGEGEFPPGIRTAWDVKRVYRIPEDCIRFGGENVIAVRVYDMWQAGGIVEGDVGVYSLSEPLALDLCLSGSWKFTTGDDGRWSTADFDDGPWQAVDVPAYWESQGHGEYNGFAWYRKSVVIPRRLLDAKLILLLGRIDDTDQTYFNGTLIGSTGSMNRDGTDDNDSYRKERAYFIPMALIRKDRPNVIAVRVLDTGGGGGIYEGSLGILTREKYLRTVSQNKR